MLLQFESQVIGAAVDAVSKITALKANGRTSEISDALQTLSDQIQRVQYERKRPVLSGPIDVRQLALEATRDAVAGIRPKP